MRNQHQASLLEQGLLPSFVNATPKRSSSRGAAMEFHRRNGNPPTVVVYSGRRLNRHNWTWRMACHGFAHTAGNRTRQPAFAFACHNDQITPLLARRSNDLFCWTSQPYELSHVRGVNCGGLEMAFEESLQATPPGFYFIIDDAPPTRSGRDKPFFNHAFFLRWH
jgi:hypothetical protein